MLVEITHIWACFSVLKKYVKELSPTHKKLFCDASSASKVCCEGLKVEE